MVLNSFDLEGKVALVTGCNTGLGQAMAVGLAQAGCDIIGVNRSEPNETLDQVHALGRRFLDLRADLTSIGCLKAPLANSAISIFWSIMPVSFAARMR
jgi:2-deoxy-D-gluconate 3-dehydrogenase